MWGLSVKLFGYLPESLFQPLAGPRKHVYGRLLLRLYERLFATRILDMPTKDEVLRHLASALQDTGVSSSDELSEEGVEADSHSVRALRGLPSTAKHRMAHPLQHLADFHSPKIGPG